VTIAPKPEPAPVEDGVEKTEGAVVTTSSTIRWLYWRGTLWLLIALGIQALASLMPAVVELVYSQRIYYYISRSLSLLNRLFPFSLGEVFIGALALWFVGWTIWYLRRAVRGESPFFTVVKLLFLHLLWTFATLHAIFLILWGLNFQRTPIADTWALDRRPARSDELQSVAARIVDGINRNFLTASEGQDWGSTSRLPLTYQRLNQALETSFGNAALLGPASQGGLTVPKELRLSRVTSYLGVSGIFLPFTGEPTFNVEIPAHELPFVIANQKAHQRGYAREDEANLVAYVVCTNSSEAYIRYSGYLHAVKVLEIIERAGVGRYRDSISRGPSGDLEYSRRFWGAMKYPEANQLATQAISAYLRLNRVTRGVENYDEDIPLIIAYHLKYPNRQ
jgi:hypothetical protein